MRLREELTALTRREKVTTLLVTHDLDEAIELADHLFFLSSRPARVILERRLSSVPRTRSRQDIAIIGDELRQLVLQANALTRDD
jgi:NitT/TauT family transport system ATP-binding protein